MGLIFLNNRNRQEIGTQKYASHFSERFCDGICIFKIFKIFRMTEIDRDNDRY